MSSFSCLFLSPQVSICRTRVVVVFVFVIVVVDAAATVIVATVVAFVSSQASVMYKLALHIADQ